MKIEERLERLERTTSRWRLAFVLQSAAILTAVVVSFTHPKTVIQAGDNVLHVRGLVVEDSLGRSRVLLGAPFPETHDRLRQDTRTAAMVFLDEQGHDRLSLGEETPAQTNGKVPQNAHRIAPGFGVTIHDTQGNERGGITFLSNGRAVIALDRPNGDAWAAMVDDQNGFAGTLSIYDRAVGDGATGIFEGTQGKRAFIMAKGLDDMPRGEFAIGPDQQASFKIFDKSGNNPRDVLVNLVPVLH